ncbi:MAG: hypothetical protein AB7R89_19885 [Dehalococcoidia bacterium]
MPTYEWLTRFMRDFERLTPAQRAVFLSAVAKLVHDLQRGSPRAGLRVEAVHASEKVFEMTWAPDGRATFQYGPEKRPGHVHIVWRRIGTHAIFDDP